MGINVHLDVQPDLLSGKLVFTAEGLSITAHPQMGGLGPYWSMIVDAPGYASFIDEPIETNEVLSYVDRCARTMGRMNPSNTWILEDEFDDVDRHLLKLTESDGQDIGWVVEEDEIDRFLNNVVAAMGETELVEQLKTFIEQLDGRVRLGRFEDSDSLVLKVTRDEEGANYVLECLTHVLADNFYVYEGRMEFDAAHHLAEAILRAGFIGEAQQLVSSEFSKSLSDVDGLSL